MRDRHNFFIKSIRWIRKHAMYQDSILLAGDLNCCLRDSDRRPNDTIKNNYSRKGLLKLMSSFKAYQASFTV